jgi:hypothetical protein
MTGERTDELAMTALAAVPLVTRHEPRQHRWHKIESRKSKSRKSKSATYSRKLNSRSSFFAREDRYPRLSLPEGAMQSHLRTCANSG